MSGRLRWYQRMGELVHATPMGLYCSGYGAAVGLIVLVVLVAWTFLRTDVLMISGAIFALLGMLDIIISTIRYYSGHARYMGMYRDEWRKTDGLPPVSQQREDGARRRGKDGRPM